MKYLDLSLSSPDQNLACDEALLDWQEDKGADEILRVWEPQEYFVVLGYANKAASEARLDLCRQKKCAGVQALHWGRRCPARPGMPQLYVDLEDSGTKRRHQGDELLCHESPERSHPNRPDVGFDAG